ncbi:filamentous hemagglutinin N-terminal domain-containing protein [Phormidium sp. FACHB-592]|uniref:Filamentous hemagglutinin N-terminal domain-containing protein n=1 Tax=Stenomitos frigidus AS-A4 TaxID=2933935 RepID=A0ABV0KII3_9CYAN|nr:filamentous hemagglutinin N-terminal domain-containing protein [Phormidium sp. FACHB-592]MBD2075716.1 filamentous hemagglutinin N-terminal domain-containing protein [Phormidium sp. FACHB-592]
MVGRSQWLRFISQVCCLTLLGLGDRSVAQVTPDTTLPSGERSQVSAGPLFQIDGGAIRDRNLFHSFAQFSLRQGETTFFNNAATITNIISRVTGGQPSQLDGLIQTSGSANLFFINPSGILFGPNAALNVGGSFLATTASAIQFGNEGLYSATNPTAPSLLTVNPSALLFNQLANQSIVSQAKLQVPSGQSLALVGGNVLLNQAALLAQGGRVELGGLFGQGVVALNGNGSSLRLSYQDLQQPLADLSLTGAEVNVRTGGSIGVNAQNLRLASGSKLQGGVATGEGIPGSKAGDIDLKVSGAIVFTDGSLIDHATLGNADSGNVNVTAGSILLKDGSQINASSFGRGNSGTVTLRSQGAVIVDGEASGGRPGGIFSQINANAVGNSGGINIFAESVTVTNGALLSASTLGIGDSGSINIQAQREVRFAGVGSVNRSASGAFSGVQSGAVGNSSGITIVADSLLMENGAQLDANTFGQGNAGLIDLRVLDAVTLKGDSSGVLGDPGGIYSYIGERAIGNSSGISITARSFSMQNGAALVASTFGQGNGGDIRLQIADSVTLDGQTPQFSSGIFSSVSRIAQGDSGQISLAAASLTVTNGAAIATSALGNGKMAGVNINVAGAVSFDGVGLDGFPSGIFSRVGRGAIKDEIGGNAITVTARSVSLTNGAQFQTSTLGQQPAGSISINAIDDVRIVGKDAATGQSSGLFSATTINSSGNGGNVNVGARSLYLQDNAVISAQSRGRGNAGTITLSLHERLQAIDSQILTTSAQAAGGNIAIAARIIELRGNSDLTTSVLSGTGSGGNITLGAQAIVALDDSDILAASRDGSGGDITLNTPAFFGFRYRPDADSSNIAALDGNDRVDVNASGRLRAGNVVVPRVTLQPSRVSLPTEVVDTSQLIAQSCMARSLRQGSFIVTGAGGLPSLPDDLVTTPFATDETTLVTSVQANRETGNKEDGEHSKTALGAAGASIVEADGLYELENGGIVLGRSCNRF